MLLEATHGGIFTITVITYQQLHKIPSPIVAATSSVTVSGEFTIAASSTTNTNTTPPIINLNGPSTIELSVGDTWTDPGATATDETDGDITSSITVNGTVDTSTVGTYTLIYNVADAASNTASVTRTVVVNPASTTSIYFENGTCKCPNANYGETRTIDGIVYTAVTNKAELEYEISAENYNLCTSGVTDMSDIFKDNTSFNSNIDFWDTSNVTNMSGVFNGATAFNQDIGSWDTSNVTDMSALFSAANAFNQNIGPWDLSSVVTMYDMFKEASVFNQDISNWNTA